MKGTIVKCLEELIENKFSPEQWKAICNKSDFHQVFINIATDIDDAMVMSLLHNTCAVLEISLQQAADAFGDYWVNDYAPVIYKSVFQRFANAREFILGMDDVHVQVTKNIANARPPRFNYKWVDEITLRVDYKSGRGLIDIYVGLVKGLGRYFQEDLEVRKLDDKTVEIVFKE